MSIHCISNTRSALLGVTSRPPRGLAATAAALLLFFAMGIIVAFTNRNLIFEQRTSANQYRATKAFEAAEAGLEWAVAQLNGDTKINTLCVADNAGVNAFRERYVTVNSTTGAITAGAVRPVCVMPAGGGAFSCSCPTAGLATATGSGAAFRIEFSTEPTPGMVRLTSYGCTSAEGTCGPSGAGGSPDAEAKVTVLLGVIPQVGTAPGAALTAKTDVNIGNAALGVINTDVYTNGITIDAGGTITAPNARLTTIPGSPASSSTIAGDTSLSSISTDQLFATFFGMSKTEFQASATLTTDANFNTDYANACASCRVFWVEGDLDLSGTHTYGDSTNPVIVVVNGNVHINGTINMTGILYAANTTFDDTGGGNLFLRGAAVSEGSFTGNGTPDIFFDASVMRVLTRVPGAFIKIPGSWKDF
jgi:Tfp pilus assembly protein PilX